MSVKLTNFVNININRHISSGITSSMDTALLLKFVKTDATLADDHTYESIDEVTSSMTDGLEKYLTIFFKNGGQKLKVVEVKYTPAAGTTAATFAYGSVTGKSFKEMITALTAGSTDIESNIVVGYMNTTYSGTVTFNQMTEAAFNGFAAAYNDDVDGLYKKIFIGRIAFADIASYACPKIENYVCKAGAAGIEATVMAYLTRINGYKSSDTVDYAFTVETFKSTDIVTLTETDYYTTDNTMVENVISKNLNCDSILVGSSIVDIGGNDTNGNELVNQYILILVQRTLTSRLTKLIQTKIKLNGAGMAAVLSACNQELNKYLSSGYLSTDKIWEDDDLYYNGTLIIPNGANLPSGYKATIMPLSTLTAAQKAAHQLPEIYLLLADGYSIRKIVITGEVF